MKDAAIASIPPSGSVSFLRLNKSTLPDRREIQALPFRKKCYRLKEMIEKISARPHHEEWTPQMALD